ncbi:hypothetical protein [Escherichia coli]|uniref:hypothetical protein n=1 Tax=Escherichia coli TaxID=562 RepID=UPI003B9BC1B7
MDNIYPNNDKECELGLWVADETYFTKNQVKIIVTNLKTPVICGICKYITVYEENNNEKNFKTGLNGEEVLET